jgi:DNA-binding NtrC family response regulator
MTAEISEARQLFAESIADPKTFQARIADAIRESGGNLSEAARRLGISRRTLYRYIAEHPSLIEMVEKTRLWNDTKEREYDRRMQRKSRATKEK